MNPNRVIVCFFSYETCAPDSVRRLGRVALRDPATAPKRSNLARELSFYAGRASVAAALQHLGREAWVEPNPEFGYLTAVDRHGISQPDLFINISHTRQIAVAIVASTSVVGDIESLTRNASIAIRRVATEKELEGWFGKSFSVGGVTLPGELALWSAKEAVSKAVGLGIKFGMRHFEIALTSSPPPYEVKLGIIGPLSVPNPAVRFLLREGFLVALCAEKSALASPPEILSVSGR